MMFEIWGSFQSSSKCLVLMVIGIGNVIIKKRHTPQVSDTNSNT